MSGELFEVFNNPEIQKKALEVLVPALLFGAGAVALRRRWHEAVKQQFQRVEEFDRLQKKFIGTLWANDDLRIVNASVPEISKDPLQLVDINGTQFYYLLVEKDGKQFALAGETLDSIKIAFGVKLSTSRDISLIRRAQLVEFPSDGSCSERERMRLHAATVKESLLAGRSLYASDATPNGKKPEVYHGKDIKISIIEQDGKTYAKIKYRKPDFAATDARFYDGSSYYASLDITEIVKNGGLEMPMCALFLTITADQKARDKFLNQYFVRRNVIAEWWKKIDDKLDKKIKTLKLDDLTALLGLLDPAGAILYAESKAHAKELKKQIPTSMVGLVTKVATKTGPSDTYEVIDGALKGTNPSKVPDYFSELPNKAWDQFSELFKAQVALPLYGIYYGKENRVVNAYGFALQKNMGAIYAFYDPQNDFPLQAIQKIVLKNSAELVHGNMSQKLKENTSPDVALAAKELMKHGNVVLRYKDGIISEAPIDLVYDKATKVFKDGYKDEKNWTPVTAEKTDRLIAEAEGVLNKRAKAAATTPATTPALVA